MARYPPVMRKRSAPRVGPSPSAPVWKGPMRPVMEPKDDLPKYWAIIMWPRMLSPPAMVP